MPADPFTTTEMAQVGDESPNFAVDGPSVSMRTGYQASFTTTPLNAAAVLQRGLGGQNIGDMSEPLTRPESVPKPQPQTSDPRMRTSFSSVNK